MSSDDRRENGDGRRDTERRRPDGAAGDPRDAERRRPRDGGPSGTPGPGRRLLAGGATGAVTFLAGWLVTMLAFAGSFSREGRPIPMYDDLFKFGRIPEWKASLWYFHGGHFGQMQKYGERTVARTNTYQNYVNVLVDQGISVASTLLPVVLLVLAGFALAWILGAREAGTGAMAGASVVVGYLAVAVVAGLVMGVSSDTYSLGPFWPSLVLLTGVAYPLAFGGLGGAIAGRLR